MWLTRCLSRVVFAVVAAELALIGPMLRAEPPPKQSFPVNLAIALGTLIALGTAGLFALRRVILRSLD